MPRLLLGDDELDWGADDVLDYLAQFGNAFMGTAVPDFVYLGEPGCENNRGPLPYLFGSPRGAVKDDWWAFYVRSTGDPHRCLPAYHDVALAVKHYRRAKRLNNRR